MFYHTKQITEILKVGADIIVIGNSLEDNPELLEEFAKTIRLF